MRRDSGSIGIGAMIVFIALILVAAVASTIIIKAIEDLQQFGEDASIDVRQELSNKVVLESAFITGNFPSTCEATLYEHHGAGGWAATYSIGDYSGGDFLDPDNDGVDEATHFGTSIQVDEGCRVILYGDSDFGGGSVIVEGGFSDESDWGPNADPVNCGGTCDNWVSSIKVLSFELELHMRLAAGSKPIYASDIFWSASCETGGFAGYYSEGIVYGGSSLLDGTNTVGVEADFDEADIIEVGMHFKVQATFKSCLPSSGTDIQFYIHVDGGATTFHLLPLRQTEVGTDILFDP